MKPLTLAIALSMLMSASLSNLGAQESKQPNIIVFLVDDMGVMDTSVPFLTTKDGKAKRYPLNNHYRTPNMEKLAQRGIRFNNFYAHSVCSPTRISIMTGQNSARHRCTNFIRPNQNNRGEFGPQDWRWTGIAEGEVTLAALLQALGYFTIHVGKGHFGSDNSFAENPSRLGFDVNIAGHSWGAPGSYYGKKNYGKGTPRAVPGLKKYHGTDTFLTEALTIEANAQIEKAVHKNQPFFLYMAHYAVHAPFNSDPRFAKNYEKSGKSKNAQAFATLIEGMDKSLGDILDKLDDLKVADNTLIIFLGDNGSDGPLGAEHIVACAAPLRGKKGTHYEGGVRVPFITAWARPDPSQPNQKRLPIARDAIQTQVAAVQDIFPTVLKVVGAKNPPGHIVDGSDLSTLLTGKRDPRRKETFLSHFPQTHRSSYFTSYRDGDWKVIYHYYPSKANGSAQRYELFNLKSDPFEQSNLAESSPAELRRMMQSLIAALESHDALYPVAKDQKTPLRPMLPK